MSKICGRMGKRDVSKSKSTDTPPVGVLPPPIAPGFATSKTVPESFGSYFFRPGPGIVHCGGSGWHFPCPQPTGGSLPPPTFPRELLCGKGAVSPLDRLNDLGISIKGGRVGANQAKTHFDPVELYTCIDRARILNATLKRQNAFQSRKVEKDICEEGCPHC